MIDILKFIFTDFWHWLGTTILISVLTGIRAFSVNIYRNKKD